jgi:hypothetical protein
VTKIYPHKRPRFTSPSQGEAYEVGYAKPPASTRFKPGQSGNPKGRPRGSKNKRPKLNEERFKEIVLAEAYRAIKVNDGEKKVTLPMAQAVIRAIAVNAAKGQHRAQHLFAELVSSTERANKALHDEYIKTLIEYKAGWEKTLERRQALGIVAPEPIPHPDDIIIDMKTGEAHICGPMTKEEKVLWESIRKRVDDSDEEIRELKTRANDPKSKSCRQAIEADIEFETKLQDRLRIAIRDWPHRRGKPREVD